MITIGLTGSIAMGKSEVAKIFMDEGIPVFDADKEVHDLYDTKAGAEMLRPLVPDVVINDFVDRAELSKLVLANPETLSKIETVVHSEIARRRKSFLLAQREAGQAVVVLDVPLLFEKEQDKDVDHVIVVSAPSNLQRSRALQRPGMTASKLDMILKRQMPDAEKRRRADFVIENNSSLQDLRKATLAVLAQIRKAATP